MRVKHDYGAFTKAVLRNSEKSCTDCGKPTKPAYRSDRHLFFLNGGLHVFYDVRTCGSPGCAPRVPEEIHLHALPYREYALDVVALVGHRRLRQNLTFSQIAEQLRGEHKVQIVDREVE